MNTNPEINEMISALIDSESTASDEDTAVIRKDPMLEKCHLEYLQIGNLIRALPTPEPSAKFVEEVLVRLPQNALTISYACHFPGCRRSAADCLCCRAIQVAA